MYDTLSLLYELVIQKFPYEPRSPTEDGLLERLEQAQVLLRDASIPIKDVCFSSGYDDPRYFAKFFKKHTGMTPSEFRNLYAGCPSAASGEAAP